jgi:hypothetical protein
MSATCCVPNGVGEALWEKMSIRDVIDAMMTMLDRKSWKSTMRYRGSVEFIGSSSHGGTTKIGKNELDCLVHTIGRWTDGNSRPDSGFRILGCGGNAYDDGSSPSSVSTKSNSDMSFAIDERSDALTHRYDPVNSFSTGSPTPYGLWCTSVIDSSSFS